MKTRLLRRLALATAAVAVPLALVGLVPVAGNASIIVDPSQPPPPPDVVVISVAFDTVAWEKTACKPSLPIVWLSQAADVPVTVLVDTRDATAVAPGDYVPIKGLKLTIPAGSLSATVPLQINDDGLKEPDEYFTVTISSPSVGVIGKGTAVVTIKDGQQPPPCDKH